MKNILLIITIILCSFYSGFAQQATTVYTPYGTAVSATHYTVTPPVFKQDELNAFIIALNEVYGVTGEFPDTIGGPSRTYNCHGYAWHMVNISGTVINTPVWINDPYPYIDDCSYAEAYFINNLNNLDLQSVPDSAKVLYYSGEHSAVLIDKYNDEYISKWGPGFLVRHPLTSTPYNVNTSGYGYFVPAYRIVFNANGGAFSTSTLGSNTVTYRGTPKNNGNGGSVSAPPDTTLSFSGHTFLGWAKTSNGTPSIYNVFWVDEDDHNYTLYAIWAPVSINGADQLCSGTGQYTLQNPPSGTIYWTSSNTSLLTVTSSGNPATATRQGSSTGSVTLSARTGSVSGTVVATKTVTVCALPPPPPVINGADQLCSGTGQYTLQNPPVGTIYWTSSNTSLLTVTSSGNPTTATRQGSSTGSVTLSARTGSVSGTVVATKTVTVCALPSPPVISGSSLLCYGSSTTFSATNWQSGYYWDKSNSLLNISNSSSSSTSISVAGSSSQGAVTLSVKNSSGTTLATYNAWVGAPTVYIYPNFTNDTYDFTATPAANTGVNVYSWGASPGSISGNGTSAIYYPNGITGWHDIWVTSYNNCGSCTSYSGFSYDGRGGSTFVISPNPASTEVEISIYDNSEESRSAGGGRYTVTILDSNDTVVFQRTYSGKQFTVPVSSLSNGTYIVEISNGKVTNTQQLVIKR